MGTTTQAGNWSDTATWVGGVVPTDPNETFTQNHNVTVDVSATCGAIVQAATGVVLTIAAGITLTRRGKMNVENNGTKRSNLILLPGSALLFDSGNPTGTDPQVMQLYTSGSSHSRIESQGVSGNPARLGKIGAGANVEVIHNAGTNAGGGWSKFRYLRMDGVTYRDQWLGFSGAGNAEIDWENVELSANCGRIQLLSNANAGGATGGVFRFVNVVHKGGDGLTGMRIEGSAAGATTAIMQDCFFEQELECIEPEGWSFLANTIAWSGMGSTSPNKPAAAAVQSVLRRHTRNDVYYAIGNDVGCYELIDNQSVGDNPHPIYSPHGFDWTRTDCHMDPINPAHLAGDMIIMSSPPSVRTTTLVRETMGFTPAGLSAGKIVSALGNANSRIAMNHCTFASDDGAAGTNSEVGAGLGETFAGVSGMVTSCKSNLAVSLNAARAVVIAGANHTGKVPDTAPAANVTHNGSINGKTSTSSGVTAFHDYATDAGTNNFWPTGTLNVSGVNVAGSVPLVAPDRNALKWAVTRGQAESLAGLKTVLLRSVDWTDANYDPAAANKVPALLTWVRDGFVTTHAPFNNAGHDGVTIGAMPYSAVAAGPTIGASPPPTIVHGGALNLPIVNADAGDRTVAIIQGAVTLPLAETGGTNSNIIVPTVTLEQVDPLTSLRRVFDTQDTNAVIRVTRTSDSATVDHPIRVIDPANQTHGNPIITGGVLTSVPPWIVGDQLQARGPGGGALPADFTIYGDGNVGASASGNFEYRVYDSVTNTVGAWALATVSVGVSPSITVQPTNQTVSEGATATFSVVATGDAPLAYQWQKNLSNIVGATSATYITPATVIGDNGSTYRCVVTNTYGVTTSNTATLTVSGVISPPGPITGLAVTAITTTGATVSYNSTPTATSYEYTLDGTNYIDVGLVLTFALTGLLQYTNYSVGVRAKNGSGVGAQSSFPFRTLDGIAPSQPQDLSTPTIGATTATVAFTAATDNVAVTGYRYRVNGGSWINIGLSYSFSISGLSPGVAQLVEIVAYDAAGNTGFPASINFTTLTLSATPMTIGEIRFHVLHKIWRFVNEGSSINVRVFFRNGRMSATPISVRYRLSCEDTGQCLLDWTSTTPAAQVDLVIPASFNTLISQWHFFERRTLTVEATSIDGNVQIGEYTYFIRNIIGVH